MVSIRELIDELIQVEYDSISVFIDFFFYFIYFCLILYFVVKDV